MLISLLIPKILLKNEKFVDNENEITHTYTSMERVYLYIMGYNPDFYYKWDLVDKIFVAIALENASCGVINSIFLIILLKFR